MKSKLLFLFLFIISSFAYSNSNQTSTELSPIILILDGSGSMWGKIGADIKIEIARDVVDKVLDKMDPAQPIGLVVYGHRQKGDCDDIETLINPGINNHKEIKKALASINPTGKTPLANTALKVIKQLKKDQQKATLILISDGEESCNGDLCKVIREAKEAGVDFVLHIVGFDLGDLDQLALECAAKEGNGIYLNAKNGAQLNEALIQTTSLPVQELEPTLSVKVIKDRTLHDAVVKIALSGNKDIINSHRTYSSENTNPALIGLEPGTYDISAKLISSNVTSITKENVVVVKEKVKEVIFDFSAGKVSILTTGNGKLWDSVVNIPKTGESNSIAKGRTYKHESTNPMIKELSPDSYDVKVEAMKLIGDNTANVFKGIEIGAGETIEVEHNYEFGELLVSCYNNDIHWDCVLNVNAGKEYEKYLAGGRTGKDPNGKPNSYLATTGYYNVLFKPHGIFGKNVNFTQTNIKVEAGSVQNIIHNYNTGLARITVKNQGKLWKSVVSIYQDKEVVYSKRTGETINNNPLDINLLPGVYQVIIMPLKLDVEKRKFELVIKKGEVNEKVVTF